MAFISTSEKISFGAFGALFVVTLLAMAVGTNVRTYADDEPSNSSDDVVTITVQSACTLKSTSDSAHTGSITPNRNTDEIGITTITITCNDADGHAVYAVGYGNNTWNETRLLGENGNSISTLDRVDNPGESTPSHWYMKLYDANKIAIQNNYDSYKAVPGGVDSDDEDGYMKVAAYTPTTGTPETTSFKTTYGVYASASQASGSYSGKVKYTLVDPHMSDDKNKPKSADPTMQAFTKAEAEALTGETTLIDSRDGQSYTVAKLDDGNVWMTSNLRLGKGNGEVIALDSTNSDLPSGKTFDLKASGMAWSGGDGVAAKADGDCSVGSWFESDWSGFDEAHYDVSHLCIDTTENSNYGNYYNWYTATAGTGTYSVGENGDEDAAGSICPKGWKLPANEGNPSYANLFSSISDLDLYSEEGSNKIQSAPYNFLLAGYTGGEGIYDQGDLGLYWSSTAYDSVNAYYLLFDTGNINPQTNDNKGYGNSVRCVFGS